MSGRFYPHEAPRYQFRGQGVTFPLFFSMVTLKIVIVTMGMVHGFPFAWFPTI